MCGIAGLIGTSSVTELQERVAAAVCALAHRGPDGEGLFVEPASGDGRAFALGHRRLAIIDPTPAGAQPMPTADGRYLIAFNGEIYNYVELRDELRAAGDRFRSASDTEVLLAGYARWGLGVLDRLVGMFAFALLDRTDRTVILARDAFGMKPLYYAEGPHGLGFASEPRALLALAGLRAEVDLDGLGDYLTHGLTDHRTGTMFRGVRSVPAASHIRVSLRDGRVSDPAQYWRPSIDRRDDRPAAEIARDLRTRFLESVRLHLRSDVSVGTLLSGGIDSSAIVMAMREVGGARLDIRTFSFIPDAGAPSEETWIDAVNAASGAVPHKITISCEQWEADAARLAEHQGEPFGSLAVYAQSKLFQAAGAEGVRVLLDGQGADEMLAGYASFRGVRLTGHLRRREYGRALRMARNAAGSHAPARRTVSALVRAAMDILPPGMTSRARDVRVRASVADAAWLSAHQVTTTPSWRPHGPRVLQDRLRAALEVTSLPALLRFADRGAMMHGVESRLPFLTRDLVELSLALPDHLLVSDAGLGKSIFREAMRGLVPDSVLDRRDKIGFAVPLESWLSECRYAVEVAASAARLPCVDSRARTWIANLEANKPIGMAPTFLVWRLIGLAQWVQAYEVAIA